MRDPKIHPISHRSVLLLFCIFNPDQAYCLTVMLLANSIVRFNLSNCAFLGPINFHTDNECLRYSPLQHVLVQIDETNQWTEGVYILWRYLLSTHASWYKYLFFVISPKLLLAYCMQSKAGKDVSTGLWYLSTIHPSTAFDLSIHPRVYGCQDN